MIANDTEIKIVWTNVDGRGKIAAFTLFTLPVVKCFY